MNWVGALALLGLLFSGMSYSDGKYDTAVFWLEIAVVIGIIAIFLQKEKNKSNDFLLWLVNNGANVRNGTARYNGKHITLTTEVTQFQACFSFLILTTKSPSRFFIRGQDNLIAIGLVYTLVTLVFGWWGLPWGPIYTLETLYRNIVGGHKQNIGDMLAKIEKATAELEKTEQEKSVHTA
ncbi:MAG: hypothetical protein WC568_10295 [Candidatus Methanoperedens sp.]